MPKSSTKKNADLIFRDPYILDFLGLKDRYLEKDFEDAILRKFGYGANQRNMNAALIRSFPISYPEASEQAAWLYLSNFWTPKRNCTTESATNSKTFSAPSFTN